jgi:mycofactocin precursor peptide MftA
MEPTQNIESDTELVTETLVEEVSIDGMCGVY